MPGADKGHHWGLLVPPWVNPTAAPLIPPFRSVSLRYTSPHNISPMPYTSHPFPSLTQLASGQVNSPHGSGDLVIHVHLTPNCEMKEEKRLRERIECGLLGA